MKNIFSNKAIVVAVICVTVFLAVVAIIGSISTAHVSTVDGVIVYEYVNVRTEADSENDNNIITQLYRGDIVKIIANEGEWTKILYNDEEAYIISASVKVVENEYKEPVEGRIIYKSVNVRTEPSTESEDIGDLKLCDAVMVIANEGEWTKILYEGEEAYIISKSVSTHWIMIDVSDYNWGRKGEYDSVEEFKAFIANAKEATKFAGVYVQVQQTLRENTHWKELVTALDEMEVPYGLYIYSASKTGEAAKNEYENYLKLIEGVELKYNKYPFGVDLEKRGNQTDVIEYYNDILDDYVLYANASDMVTYGYYKLVPHIWVAHYDICDNIPTKSYVEECMDAKYDVLSGADMWQFTQTGYAAVFGTSHLDVNVVTDEWVENYAFGR